MIPKPLITYIETAIIPRYKEFDKAHNLSHVRTVIEESLALARQYPEADERLAYVIAAYHDTGLVPRPRHPPPCLRRDTDGGLYPAAMVLRHGNPPHERSRRRPPRLYRPRTS